MIDDADLDLLRRLIESANRTRTGAALDEALVALGWDDLLATDPAAAISLQFEAQGAAHTTSAALDRVIAHAVGADAPAVVLPRLDRWDAPGEAHDGRVVVRGLGSSNLATSSHVLLPWAGAGRVQGTFVPAAQLTLTPLRGIDPDLGLVAVGGRVAAVDEERTLAWQEAVDLARLALAHELTGASRAMLELARTHALARIQFGRPIAAFQAVRHRLAESLVAVEAAAATLDAARLDRSPATAAIAKAVAGRSARTVARHCQQVLAGIGFTTEHPFHRYFRRILVLDGLFGSARTLTASLGAEVLATRRLPRLAPL